MMQVSMLGCENNPEFQQSRIDAHRSYMFALTSEVELVGHVSECGYDNTFQNIYPLDGHVEFTFTSNVVPYAAATVTVPAADATAWVADFTTGSQWSLYSVTHHD